MICMTRLLALVEIKYDNYSTKKKSGYGYTSQGSHTIFEVIKILS